MLSAHGGARSGFAGNCEGGDITSGSVDVVVCNGFDGNIALKSIEVRGQVHDGASSRPA
ncbi:MAG: hypothetical protein ACLTSX_00345 [Collinsella sp.]